MRFAIITHVPHGLANDSYFAYAPYVREMNIWTQFTDAVEIVAPLELVQKTAIAIDYNQKDIIFSDIKSMNLIGFKSILSSLLHTPKTAYKIFRAMRRADHIHLRCPGNIGLLGCFIQIFFPGKTKTAKYAGNWDPDAAQPLTYRIQKWILNNTFLTKNMQVLVYGEWLGSSKNIKPFFTATYRDSDKIPVEPRMLHNNIRFLFVGSLAIGKRPLYAIQLVQQLSQSGFKVSLDLFGEGREMQVLKDYCLSHELQDIVRFQGNQAEAVVRKAYQESHFVLLPSQSEGWPKVLAEAMFWGCLPVASKVSCVPSMLDHGKRGILLAMDLNQDVSEIKNILENQQQYDDKVLKSVAWSRDYTLDLFQNQIKALLRP
ncbi:glycosyl transferase [Flavobacterium noncentrifugens]|uniref:Glycosyltransferase involved in cell wall bisynthesis n=1 Tax=Flavobacterium noncentrifugens TaxID=1128970 RepID=A0A1G8VAZ5_9FLAO|nr:glycosyltransferase [Flavobacterium noncentrifugens]GEP50415.1 glycosyl transferase [Flavobacterium noncentrifugens]SDJ63074.1 Glycosyltransferase involved in cell wall bisynthesis [Flavobacterium noncentrifugens]